MKTQADLLPGLELNFLENKEIQKLTMNIYEQLYNYYTLAWLKNEERNGHGDSLALAKREQLKLWYVEVSSQLQKTSFNEIRIHFEIKS